MNKKSRFNFKIQFSIFLLFEIYGAEENLNLNLPSKIRISREEIQTPR